MTMLMAGIDDEAMEEEPEGPGPDESEAHERAEAERRMAESARALKEKLFRYRGASYPPPDADDGRKIDYIRQLIRATDTESQARFFQGARNLLYMSGRQYLTWARGKQRWEDLPLVSETEFRVTMNYIRPILRSRTQRMLSGPVQFTARPASGSFEARDRAQVAAAFVQQRWDQTHLLDKVDQALELAYGCGVAFLKGYFNPEIGPLTPATMKRVQRRDVMQPVYDEAGIQVEEEPAFDTDGSPLTEIVRDEQGEPVIEEYTVNAAGEEVEPDEAAQIRPGDTDTSVRSVFNVRVNPDAMAWDAGAGLRWVLDTDILPVSEAREMFPDFADQIDLVGPDETSALSLERIAAGAAIAASARTSITPQYGAPDKQSVPTTVIQEYWELPSECFRGGRLMVRVGNVVVFDGAFPHGTLPFVPVYDEPAPLTPMGRPSVNDMVAPQDMINRQWTAIDQEMQLQGVGRQVTWEHPDLPDQLVADDRTVIRVPMTPELKRMGLGALFHRIETGTAGTERWHIIQEAKSALFDIAGFHEISRGSTPPGISSGVAIEHLIEQESGQLAKARRALKGSLLKWAEVQLEIARHEYGDDVTRWLPQDRADIGYVFERVTGQQLPGPHEVTIELEGFKPQSETAFKAEVKEALKDQLIDGRKALQLLDLGQGLAPAFDSQTRHYQRARWINLALEKGQYQVVQSEEVDPETNEPMPVEDLVFADGSPMVLPYDDDHGIHMAVLDELALDVTKPPEVQQAAQKLKAQRRREMDLQSAPPADAPPPPPDEAP